MIFTMLMLFAAFLAVMGVGAFIWLLHTIGEVKKKSGEGDSVVSTPYGRAFDALVIVPMALIVTLMFFVLAWGTASVAYQIDFLSKQYEVALEQYDDARRMRILEMNEELEASVEELKASHQKAVASYERAAAAIEEAAARNETEKPQS